MDLRRHLTIPSGFRRGRVPVRIVAEPDRVVHVRKSNPRDATHQLVDACGFPLLTHLSERDAACSARLAREGIWEPARTLALLNLVRPGMIVLDAGAGVGYSSVVLSRTLGPSGEVIAFEPENENHRLLAMNAELLARTYPDAAPVRAAKVALADRDGTASLRVFEGNLGSHTLVPGQGGRTEEVAVATVDRLRPERTARKIDLIQSDTRGSELSLLMGSTRLLDRDRPVLCLAFDPSASGRETALELVDLLRGLGYSAFRLFGTAEADPYASAVEQAWRWDAAKLRGKVEERSVPSGSALIAWPD
jgi:FkbM family methyltransferase